MFPYVPAYYFAYLGVRLLAQYHNLDKLILDVEVTYPDLLEIGNVNIVDRTGQTIHTIYSRIQPVDSDNSNMWASTGLNTW